jgi:hypothetical protein
MHFKDQILARVESQTLTCRSSLQNFVFSYNVLVSEDQAGFRFRFYLHLADTQSAADYEKGRRIMAKDGTQSKEYPIHVTRSGATFIKGDEFFGSKAGRKMIKRAAEFGRKHISEKNVAQAPNKSGEPRHE